MTFYTPSFIFIFLPCLVALYAFCPRKLKNACLFLGSVLFYFFASGNKFTPVLIILGIALFNYLAGFMIWANGGKRKTAIFAVSSILNAVALLSPKVVNIVCEAISGALPEGLAIVAPIGFSFYMFKNMSYLRQVYDEKITCESSFFALGAYLLNFAQILSGPIQTYADFKNQLKKNSSVTLSGINSGLYEFIIGLSLKILLADRIIRVWTSGLYGINSIGVDSISTPLAWLGFFSFPLYLYFEFYGYSLMSRGVGRMLGYETPDNFCYPYLSKTVSEFWRRWHMTLGEWFKENIYFPMGGSRQGTNKTIFNLSIVWLCTGVWHALCFGGTGVNFMLWAAYLLLFILLEKLGVLKKVIEHKVWSHVYLVTVIAFSWVIFNTNLTTVSDLLVYLGRLWPFGEVPPQVSSGDWLRHLGSSGVLMLVGVLFLTPMPRMIFEKLRRYKWVTAVIALATFWASTYLIFCEGANPMVY